MPPKKIDGSVTQGQWANTAPPSVRKEIAGILKVHGEPELFELDQAKKIAEIYKKPDHPAYEELFDALNSHGFYVTEAESGRHKGKPVFIDARTPEMKAEHEKEFKRAEQAQSPQAGVEGVKAEGVEADITGDYDDAQFMQLAIDLTEARKQLAETRKQLAETETKLEVSEAAGKKVAEGLYNLEQRMKEIQQKGATFTITTTAVEEKKAQVDNSHDQSSSSMSRQTSSGFESVVSSVFGNNGHTAEQDHILEMNAKERVLRDTRASKFQQKHGRNPNVPKTIPKPDLHAILRSLKPKFKSADMPHIDPFLKRPNHRELWKVDPFHS